MSLALRATHLRRYADIAALLVKHGRSDLVRKAGLEEVLAGGDVAPRRGEPDPEDLVRDLERMGPTFVKIGQLLSTRADLLPAPYLEALSRLQDRVEPVPFEDVERTISFELKARLETVFETFEREPVASASLGQVHHATLHDGQHVVVKVQRPGIRERVTEDLDVLEEIAVAIDTHTDFGRRWATADIVRQFREMLLRELDYRLEARNLVTLAKNLEEFKLLVVPQPLFAYSGPRVLTMEEVHGWKITDVGPLRTAGMDGAALAEELFRAYLKQVLVDGFVHADPHPGNVFLTDDGRIALLDLGMVARVPARLRDQVLKLIVAVSRGAGDEAADVATSMGEPLDWFDEPALRRDITSLVAWNEGLHLADIGVGRVVTEIARLAGRNGLRVPSELALLGKTLLNLDEVGRALDPHFDPNASVRRNAGAIAKRRLVDGFSFEDALATLTDTTTFLRTFPSRANKILDGVANDGIKLKVDAIDEDRLISGLQRIANRITVGLLLASLVVGAALLMRIETRWTMFGYPGLAITLFMLAAVGASTLAIHILHTDGRRAKGRLKRPK